MNSASVFRETTSLQENKLHLHTYITNLHVLYLSEVGGHLITLNPQRFQILECATLIFVMRLYYT